LTGVSDSTGRSILYQYDALGNRVQMTAPDGNTFSYQYDVANRLSQILSPAGTFGFSYDPSGRRTGLSYPSGVKTQYSYDPSGFLTGLMAQVSQGPLINSFAYTQDAMGNRTSMTDISGTHQYTYDAIYQLTRAIHPSGPREQYRYDPVGNRLKKTVDADNRLLEDNNHRYEYDSNGNLTQETNKKTGEVRTFGYDDENRLNVFQDSNTVAEYKYDPFGRRVEKKVNGKVTRYVYDGAHILMEYGEDNKVTSRFVHSLTIDEPLALERGKKVYYYHADGLGSITDLTDAKGNIVKEYQYKSYGALQWQTGTLAQPFRFTGREFDPESGLYYYRARYYNSRMGRFLTKDPIGFAGGDVNLFRYLGNNPVNRRDPSGLIWGEFLGRIVGPLVGASAQEAAIAGRMTEALVGAGMIASGNENPMSFKNQLGIVGEGLQLTGGIQTIFLSEMILAGSSSFPPTFAIILAGAGGIEVGMAFNEIYERLSGQPLGADIYDWEQAIRNWIQTQKNRIKCGK
jgi:RHS repeat-associated protein